MSEIRKTSSNISYNGRATVVKGLKSHADDPFFVKKAEDAKAFLQQHPIPARLIKK